MAGPFQWTKLDLSMGPFLIREGEWLARAAADECDRHRCVDLPPSLAPRAPRRAARHHHVPSEPRLTCPLYFP